MKNFLRWQEQREEYDRLESYYDRSNRGYGRLESYYDRSNRGWAANLSGHPRMCVKIALHHRKRAQIA
ncbi:MAG: hypothetical protein ABS920_00880 [Sporosarcina sp.]